MRKSYLRADSVPDSATGSDLPVRRLPNVPGKGDPMEDADDEAVAAYLLDLMIATRRVAAKRGFSFLAYLIGVAAEESRLLTLGRSAVRREAGEKS